MFSSQPPSFALFRAELSLVASIAMFFLQAGAASSQELEVEPFQNNQLEETRNFDTETEQADISSEDLNELDDEQADQTLEEEVAFQDSSVCNHPEFQQLIGEIGSDHGEYVDISHLQLQLESSEPPSEADMNFGSNCTFDTRKLEASFRTSSAHNIENYNQEYREYYSNNRLVASSEADIRFIELRTGDEQFDISLEQRFKNASEHNHQTLMEVNEVSFQPHSSRAWNIKENTPQKRLYDTELNANAKQLYPDVTEVLPRNQVSISCENESNVDEREDCYEDLRRNSEQRLNEAKQKNSRRDEAEALLSLGNAYLGLEDYESARESFQDAFDVYGIDFPDGQADALIGNLLSYLELESFPENIESSLSDAEKVKELVEGLQPNSQPSRLLGLATFYYGLSNSESNSEYIENAIQLSNQALNITRELDDHPFEEITALILLGTIYDSLGRYEDAVDVYQQLPGIYESLGNSVGQANALVALGDTLAIRGSYEEAIRAFERADALLSNSNGTTENRATVKLRLSEAYFDQGTRSEVGRSQMFSRAEESGNEALRLFNNSLEQARLNDEDASPTTQAGISRALELLSNIHFARGQYSEALDDLRRASETVGEIRNEVFKDRLLNLLDDLGFAGDTLAVLQIIFPPLRAISAITQISTLLAIADDLPALYDGFTDVIRGVRSRLLRNRREDLINDLEESLANARDSEIRRVEEELALLIRLGRANFDFQNYKEAEERFSEVLDESINDSNFNTYRAEAILGLAELANAQGKTEEGIERSIQAISFFLELQQDALVEQGFSLTSLRENLQSYKNGEARARLNLSLIYLKTGNYNEARSEVERALELFQELGSNYQSGYAEARLILGKLDLRVRQYEDVLTHARIAQATYSRLNDLSGEGNALLLLSDTYLTLGQYQDALQDAQRALQLFQTVGDRSGKAGALAIIGSTLQAQQQFEEASKAFEISYELQEEVEATINPREGIITRIFRPLLPVANSILGIFIRNPFDLYDAERFVQQIGTVVYFGEGAFTQLGFESEFISLGSFKQSEDALERSLRIAEGLGDRIAEARARLGLSNLYITVEKYRSAEDEAKEALEIFQSTDDRSGEAYALLALSQVYLGRAENDDDLEDQKEYYQQAIAYAQEASIVLQINVPQATQLSNPLSSEYSSLQLTSADPSDSAKSEDSSQFSQNASDNGQIFDPLSQESFNRCEVDDRYGISLAYSNIADILASQANTAADNNARQRQNALAIIFYKQAVVCREEIRRDVSALSPRLQRAYVGTLVGTYRSLVDLLLQQNRVEEALQIMELLRLQEIEDFLRTTRQVANLPEVYVRPGSENITFNEYRALLSDVIRDRRIKRELDAIDESDRTYEQRQTLETLDNQYRDLGDFLYRQFYSFISSSDVIDRLNSSSGIAKAEDIDLNILNEYSNLLSGIERETQQNAILLSPIVLEDRLEIILVMPNEENPIHVPVEDANRLDLNSAITNFLFHLGNASNENTVKEYGQELYRLLIQDIEDFLPTNEDSIILYAPDSQLRYVPLSALHDGDQWLAERFQINYVTELSVYRAVERIPSQPQVLTGAVTQNAEITIQGRNYPFDSLEFTNVEVESIASLLSDDRVTVLRDQTFTRDTALDKMDDGNEIVHFATHARFSLEPDYSIILLGDNQYFSLAEFNPESNLDDPDYVPLRFPGIELMVLSACETARGVGDRARTTDSGESSNGAEILSFGYLMQRAQIRSTIATLWRISDGGTIALMRLFYEQLLQHNVPASEALAVAQRTLIGSDEEDQNREALLQYLASQEVPASVVENLSHPFYWAPFTLIGIGFW